MIVTFNDDLTVKSYPEPAAVAAAVGTPHLRATARTDGVEQVGYEEVSPEDPRYEEALAFELRLRGETAISVDPGLRDLLDLLGTDKFTEYQRRDVISVLRNLPPDQAREMAQTILGIAHDTV
jgi:hypothetical protein